MSLLFDALSKAFAPLFEPVGGAKQHRYEPEALPFDDELLGEQCFTTDLMDREATIVKCKKRAKTVSLKFETCPESGWPLWVQVPDFPRVKITRKSEAESTRQSRRKIPEGASLTWFHSSGPVPRAATCGICGAPLRLQEQGYAYRCGGDYYGGGFMWLYSRFECPHAMDDEHLKAAPAQRNPADIAPIRQPAAPKDSLSPQDVRAVLQVLGIPPHAAFGFAMFDVIKVHKLCAIGRMLVENALRQHEPPLDDIDKLRAKLIARMVPEKRLTADLAKTPYRIRKLLADALGTQQTSRRRSVHD